mgnify:FL=1
MIEIDAKRRLTAQELIDKYKKDWGIIRQDRTDNPNQVFPLTEIQYIIATNKEGKIVGHSGWGKHEGHYMDAGGRVLSDVKEGEGRYQLPKGYNYKGQGIYSTLFDLRGKIIEPKCDKKDMLFIVSTSGDKPEVIHKSESRGYILYAPEIPDVIRKRGEEHNKKLFAYVPDSLKNRVAKALRRLLEVQ